MLIARERFLAHLLAQGTSVRRVRSIAAMLLNITEVMDLKEVRPVELPEVEDAAARWSLKPEGRNRNGQVQTVKTFTYLAKKWFRFSAMLVEILIR
jgi:hypothetical protein